MRKKGIRKTRIIATMGPACNNEKTLKAMLVNGVNIIRLNFSHGTHEDHAENIRLIRKVAASLDINPGILLDLQGPKIRTGDITDGAVTIEKGDIVTFTPDEVIGTKDRISISYNNLCDDINPGEMILIDDGLMDLTVTEIKGKDVICKVNTGGVIKPRKGVNLPGTKLSISPITEKDIKDLYFGLDSGIDFVALSFVRNHNEIIQLKKIIHEFGTGLPVIAKVEKGEAIKDIDAIIDAADGIMVARGDLGVETSPEDVPLMQKMIIDKCGIAGKPVIVATQMLDSMIHNPRPTRAEATDVSNAIFDGTDAIMLSGETAAGKYPLEAVSMMDRIARKTEKVAYRKGHFKNTMKMELLSIADATSHSIASLAENLGAKFIVAFTFSGTTAKLLSKYRPSIPILAMTHNKSVIRQLSLFWGIHPIPVPKAHDTDELMDIARKTLLDLKLVKPLDIAVISTGVPLGVAGSTNTIRVMQFRMDRQSSIIGEFKKKDRIFQWIIDEDECIHCGVCETICSSHIFKVTQKTIDLERENLKDCFYDMQCVYSCPVNAIIIRPKPEKKE